MAWQERASALQERAQTEYILDLLKDTIKRSDDDEYTRLPSFTTLLLAHALRGVFYPSTFIYPLTARFLLQRPQIDTGDVPLLFSMLYSASAQWKTERGWVLRFLSAAAAGADAWRVLRRRHTWDLLASLFQSDARYRALRRGILEVLASVTCHARAATALVLRSALLAWVEMQLGSGGAEEPLAWVKILANVVAVVDPAKMEAATRGEWRLCLGRCLRAILTSSGESSRGWTSCSLSDTLALDSFHNVSPTICNRLAPPYRSSPWYAFGRHPPTCPAGYEVATKDGRRRRSSAGFTPPQRTGTVHRWRFPAS